MTETLAIGAYTEIDERSLEADLGALRAQTLDEALALPEETRSAITAIAYKGHSAFGGDAMEAFPKLGLVANFGVGYDAIDVDAARTRGIAVTNTPDVLNDDVADLAVAMLLMQGRRMVQGDAHVRSGAWARGEAFPLNRKMSGATVGILGLGRIGHAIATRLAAFGMELHYWSRSPKETPAGWTHHADPMDLARAVDILVVSLVGGPETEGMVSAGMLRVLGGEGVVVNISRGSTIEEAALLDALESGRIAGAALDVFASEPEIDPRFASLGNVVLQPHQGSGTHATRAAMGRLQRDNIAAFHAGRALLTRVN
ncbi:2-hydroxyacid dehydrogenase [Palleronia sp. LCG004]|uniref:2-hydroxyacid dehydrogenase n=1 Tax=Palleronia sp. LCG004 TaxID=3079304 RepID=UPI002943A273|nr:2-hydroxyacid dehydrogenase [Palleronia sp. LCG004]WOI55389.1 2-hydroxyacid dehydrogenase [Palleronia sp. LCG004]